MDRKVRKRNRLEGFDYSSPGAYFITICTKNREELFWAVGARIARPDFPVPLSQYGQIAEFAIKSIPNHYPCVSVDKYAIMPNHIHLLLMIHTGGGGRAMRAPTISTVINQLKGYVTKQIGKPIWQKLFHDHIIRNEQDYLDIWEYIDTNPVNWEKDCFYENTR